MLKAFYFANGTIFPHLKSRRQRSDCTGTDRLTDFKVGEKNHPVRNATYDTPCSRSLGQIIRSGRSDIEIWQIFDLYIEKKRYLETSCDRQIIIALFMRSGR